ncbi:MAG: (Fe-S)-binding protein [Candidatus Helarchaeota archaeon]
MVEKLEITEVFPCFIDPKHIRFTIQADNKLEDIIPVLYKESPIGKRSYISESNTLTINKFDRSITFFPSGKISVTNTKDEEAAKEILVEIKKIINNAYEDFLKNGKPSINEIEATKKLSWVELYRYLPQKNCKQCGYPMCSSFAISVLQGNVMLSKCELLHEPKYASRLRKLKEKFGSEVLSSLGWRD